MFSVLLAIALLWPDPAPVDQTLYGKQHTGIFVSMFETSLFEPCGNDERWWLAARDDTNELFWNRYKELRKEREQQTGEPLGMASPPMHLTAKGEVSELGEYGHLGAYNRQFDITSFSEFRLATEAEWRQCLTSGFLQVLRPRD